MGRDPIPSRWIYFIVVTETRNALLRLRRLSVIVTHSYSGLLDLFVRPHGCLP